MGTKRLYKSRDNKVLCGVCGGLGEYFGVDPVIVRIALVVLCLLGFSGVIAYIIAVLVIPDQPVVNVKQETTSCNGTPVYTTVTKNVVESEAVVTEEKPAETDETN